MGSEPHAFGPEQAPFHGQAAAETANRAVASDHAMARDNNGNWIRAAGRTDGARGSGFANLLRNPTVGARLAARDRSQRAPDGPLESCARGEIEGNGPVHGFTGGVLLELAGEPTDEQRWSYSCGHDEGWSSTTGKIDAADTARRILDAKWAKFRADDYRITNQMIHSATKDNPSHMKKRLRSCRCARLSGL